MLQDLIISKIQLCGDVLRMLDVDAWANNGHVDMLGVKRDKESEEIDILCRKNFILTSRNINNLCYKYLLIF